MAINSNLIDQGTLAMATAHNVTPDTVSTWSPQVYRAPRVLVPIELDVLVVRDTAQRWAECGMSEPEPLPPLPDGSTPAEDDQPVSAEHHMPPPFTDKYHPRPRGAYLHWYLPNALTSGTSDSDTNTATFPPIPDRWLILRLSTSANAGRRAVRGWVLNATDPALTAVDLQNWIEPGISTQLEKPLTALGVGDLSWAGYFDNVVNRLGFADNTLDTDQVVGPLAYLVCGWYADPASDPLGDTAIDSPTRFADKLDELGWHLDQNDLDTIHAQATAYQKMTAELGLHSSDPFSTTFDQSLRPGIEAPWWPRAVLLHGAAVGIGWPNSSGGAEVGGPPAASEIKVGVGNTLAEAIGTLVARANSAPAQAAIVEALQLGVIRELEQPDGRAKLDLAVHASSFASLSGGDATTESIDIAPSGPPPGPPPNPPPPAPGVFNPPIHTSTQANTAQSNSQMSAMARAVSGGRLFADGTTPAHDYGEMNVSGGRSSSLMAEETFYAGDLGHLVGHFALGQLEPVSDPGGTFDVLRTQPRRYTPKDPVVLIQGGKRAFVHDSSVHTDDGVLNCRLGTVTALTWSANGQSYSVKGEDILMRGVQNGSVPPECDVILNETVLLDPGSATAAAVASAATASMTSGGNTARMSSVAVDPAVAQSNIQVEQTVWWALRDPRVDHSALIVRSGLTGTLPAPFAVSPPSHPWTPMHLDWTVEYVASPGGVGDWELDEIDFTLTPGTAVPPAGDGLVLQGRATLTAGASTALGASVRIAQIQAASIGGTGSVPLTAEAFYSDLAQTLTEKIAALDVSGGSAGPGTIDRSQLGDIATELDQMDVLSCGLNGLLKQLRGGLEADGVSNTADGTTPTPFVAMRAGILYFKRLRLVDGFGQYVNLLDPDASPPLANLIVSDALGVAPPNAVGLPPRFTAPARLWFRYMSADPADAGPPGKEADDTTSPVCAFVMPNHLDGGLEFFNADGGCAGSLFADDSMLVRWEDAPGSVTAAGQNPARALANPFAAQLANALIDWGVADAGGSNNDEAALQALLRTIDTTLWTVDPFAHVGDEHLSLLVGHPIAVMRAMLRLEVDDPVTTPDGTVTAVPVELGNLTHWQDGLLGYFVNDDYTRLYGATAAANMARASGPQQGFLEQINLVPQFYAGFAADIAGNTTDGATGSTAVTHPYVDRSGRFWVRPNQTVMLTLLVEPFAGVHATMGLVPRKEIGMRRAWISDGLAKIAPTFRFGPVLVDPQRIRMPLATDIKGEWVWDYRADAVKWNEGSVTNATDNALLAPDPPTAIEGWLRLEPPPVSGSG